jgi:hypothetical protein
MYDFSPYVIDNTSFLKKLSSAKTERERNHLIQEATTDQILAIVEICLNILDFNYILTKQQRRKLAKYADFYRALARTNTEEAARIKLQEGRGIVLGTLLAPILTTIAEQFLAKLTE